MNGYQSTHGLHQTVERIDRYLARHSPQTPCVVIDLETVRQQYSALRAVLPEARIYYAVKANPATPVISTLADLDIGFDLASSGEIGRCLTAGVQPNRFCFGTRSRPTTRARRSHAWPTSWW